MVDGAKKGSKYNLKEMKELRWRMPMELWGKQNW